MILLFDHVAVFDVCVPDPCGSNSVCESENGQVMCTCGNGYTGDGFVCTGNNNIIHERITTNISLSNADLSFTDDGLTKIRLW